MQIEWITENGQEKVLLKFQEYHQLELLKRWAETIRLPKQGKSYRILTETMRAASTNYVIPPYTHVYTATVEAV